MIAKQILSARLTADGRIAVSSRETREFRDFVRSLPSARWSRQLGAYLCRATPAAAWRILSAAPECCHVEAEGAIRDLSLEFEQIQQQELDLSQPAIRRFDSWEHQCAAFNRAMQLPAVLLAMRMGTGKSKVAVDVCVNKGHRRVLVLCPTSVRGVWRREFNTHAPDRYAVQVLDRGTVSRRTERAAEHMQACSLNGTPCVQVINYESAWRAPFAGWALSQDWDCVIIDESHRIKGHSSKIAKFCERLARKAGHRMALTGTPMPHSPMDVFSQFRFLDAGIFGTSYASFRNQFAVTGHFGADHIVEFKNLDRLAKQMGVLTFEVGDEVLDLPDTTTSTITTQFEPKTRKVYDQLAEDLIAELDGTGEDDPAGLMTVGNALTRSLRLRQITSGIFTPDESVERVQISDEKFKLIADLLSDIPPDEPVVVFCEFREELAELERLAGVLGRTYGEISGRRKDLTENATMPEEITLMGVQTRSGGTGIDLTRACICVYLTLPWSLGDYDQSLARIQRPGQTRPTQFYMLAVEDTMDEVVAKALDARRDVVECVLEYLRGSQPAEIF